MEQIKPTVFTENGKTIIFRQPIDADKDSFYYFKVVDDPELTKKLREAVEKRKVPKGEIYACARALFAMISANLLKPFDQQKKEFKFVYAKFQQVFKDNPKFEVEDLSDKKENIYLFRVRITNILSVPCEFHTAGTVRQAKFLAVKACLQATNVIT